MVSAPAWDGTGCELDSWQSRIYIPCSLSLRLLGFLRGSLGTYGLNTKIVLKNFHNNDNYNLLEINYSNFWYSKTINLSWLVWIFPGKNWLVQSLFRLPPWSSNEPNVTSLPVGSTCTNLKLLSNFMTYMKLKYVRSALRMCTNRTYRYS